MIQSQTTWGLKNIIANKSIDGKGKIKAKIESKGDGEDRYINITKRAKNGKHIYNKKIAYIFKLVKMLKIFEISHITILKYMSTIFQILDQNNRNHK